MAAIDAEAILRDVLSNLRSALEEAPADKRGPLAAQIRATLVDLAALEKSSTKAGDPLDELQARRAARGGSTARARRAVGGKG